MHYLTKRLAELDADTRRKVISEIITHSAQAPTTRVDKYVVASMLDYTDAARERLRNFGQMQGISSGYASIDRLTKGFVGGEMTVIAGKTSYGKTTLAVNISNHIALAGYRVLFVTLEMTHAELTSRFMFINGGITDDYYTVAANTLFQKNDELDWQSIDGLIANAKQELNVDIVFIDHLHYFSRETEQMAEDLGRITKEIKKNAQRHDVPVVLISHVRKVGKSEQANMEDLRGSSYIAQDSDIVLMVGRDEDNMHVKIEKNRNRGYSPKSDTSILLFDRIKLLERSIPWNT